MIGDDLIMCKKTILFVMPRLPFPASSGRKTSLYHYCRILSKELGHRLVVAAFLESGDMPDPKPDFIDRLEILPPAPVANRILNIIKDSIIFRSKPMQVSLYWSAEAKEIISKLVNEENPDVVIGDMIRSTEYIRDLNAYRIADLDDRISLRYKRQVNEDLANINPYGAFINTVPKLIRKFMLFKPFKTIALKNEIALLTKYEIDISKACDKTIFVAQKEADELNMELGEQKAMAVPIGVDTNFFKFVDNSSKDNKIGFLGAMNVAHNENAVRHFVDDILPLVLNTVPDVQCMIIGGGVSAELQELASNHVIFTGRVDDVREYLQQCKVFICPMLFGSGIKTKNLEAMALGLPVVTTSIGAENISAKDGKDWIVANDNISFAKAIVELLNNDDTRRQIGRNACEYINNQWTWNAAKQAFKSLLG